MGPSPTARTLRECRRRGWHVGVVERWVPAARRRVDLFGCIDLIAVSPRARGALGIQATSATNVASRVRKAVETRTAPLQAWLRAGNAFEVWGWSKRGARGCPKRWGVRRVAVVCHGEKFEAIDVPH